MKRRIFSGFALAAAIAVAGCDYSYPEVEAAMSPEAMRADYPRLVPMTVLLAEIEALPPPSGQAISDDLAVRVARLRARAEVLRRPVVDVATMTRLRSAINRLQG